MVKKNNTKKIKNKNCLFDLRGIALGASKRRNPKS